MKIKQRKVEDIFELVVQRPTTIEADAKVSELFDKMLEDHKTRHVYVVDNDLRVVGSVRLNNLTEFMMCYLSSLNDDSFQAFMDKFSEKKVSDIMLKDFLFLKKNTPLEEMVSCMLLNQVSELPVIDDDGRIIGEVNFLEFVKFLSDKLKWKAKG